METTTLDVSEPHPEERKVPKNSQKKLTIEIAGAAIFGALSIALSAMFVPLLPRVPGWYIAYFDPVSLIWICAFFIFGFRSGFLTLIVGSFGLIIFDPTNLVGPIMKFSATFWFIVIPWFYTKFKKGANPTGNDIKNLRNYIPSVILAWIGRLILMVLLNYIVLKYIYLDLNRQLDWLSLPEITGWTAVIIGTIFLNTIQTIGDAVVPYLIVFSTKIYDRFQIY
ncbi:MAG: hypothetical protein ACTSPA_15580 [Promethearchaeota archaeon]